MTAWTPERRAAQAARLRERKPWQKSTGPATAEGKARAKLNGLKPKRKSANLEPEKIQTPEPELTPSMTCEPINHLPESAQAPAAPVAQSPEPVAQSEGGSFFPVSRRTRTF
jgi:hypothetical protein